MAQRPALNLKGFFVNELTGPSSDGPHRAERIAHPESPRLRRIRFISKLLDQSIVLPGGYRIGLDPLMGLVPGVGDLLASSIAFYLVYQAARMGVPKRVLLRMSGNILLEGLVGQIPILGDLFDAVWKANVRNRNLVEQHYRPGQPERSVRAIIGFLAMLFAGVISAIGVAIWLLVQALLSLFR